MRYVQLGDVPAKRHVQFREPSEANGSGPPACGRRTHHPANAGPVQAVP